MRAANGALVSNSWASAGASSSRAAAHTQTSLRQKFGTFTPIVGGPTRPPVD